MAEDGGKVFSPRFRVFIESTQPEPDHTVTIESSLNQASQAVLKLNLNHTGLSKFSREYRAEFTPDSATEFTVSPKQGLIYHDDPSK